MPQKLIFISNTHTEVPSWVALIKVATEGSKFSYCVTSLCLRHSLLDAQTGESGFEKLFRVF